jgi:hypothetical protein
MGYWVIAQVWWNPISLSVPTITLMISFLITAFFLAAGTKLFAECAMQFLLNGPSLSTPVDFSKRNLVGIGHSIGGVAV